jgi:hypothetical protein
MTKLFLVLSIFMISTNALIANEIRNSFLTVTTIKEADYYIQLLEESNMPEAPAYLAAMVLMKAKFAFFPFNKWRYFKKGSLLLDAAIHKNPKNLEMRYLRFLFQSQMPKFLGYHKNLKEDYELIMINIKNCSIPLNFKKTMLNKMLLVKRITPFQTNEIKNIMQKL